MNNKRLYLFSFLLLAFLMIALALNYWPNADDFCFRTRVDQSGLIQYIINYYKTWSGRVFTLWFLGLTIKILPLQFSNIVSCIFVILFLFSIYLYARIWQKHLSIPIISSLSIILFLFWFGLRGIIGEVIYWPTGAATYLIPFTLGLIWMSNFENDLGKTSFSFIALIIHFIFGLLVGNGIEVLSPILCTYGFLLLFSQWTLINKKMIIFHSNKILAIIVGTLLSVMAPGNFERAKSFPQGVSFEFISLMKNLGSVIWIFFSFTKTLLMFSVFAAIMILILNSTTKFNKQKLRRLSLILFISSLSSLIPMTFVDVHFTTRRTTFYFAVTLSLSLIYWLLSFQDKITKKISNKLSNLIFLMMAISTASSIGYDLIKAVPIRKNFLIRDQILRNIENKNETILLDKLADKSPKSLFFEEIIPDESYWVNSCIAGYYSVKKVKLRE